MKVVIAGNWRADIHEAALAAGFEANGAEVLPFRWNQYFDLSAKGTKYFFGKLQYKFNFGPKISKLNRDLVEFCIQNAPDLVFLQA